MAIRASIRQNGRMRIATWNINRVRARLDILLHWLKVQNPDVDVVALQKIYVPEQQFPKDAFERVGYHAEAHCCSGGNDHGVAILSRTKPRILDKGLSGQEGLGARLLTVDVGGLEFSSVYAPSGEKEGINAKLEWFESLTLHLRATRSRSEQRVLCGDFNVVPAYRYASNGPVRNSLSYHKDVQERFEALLENGGLHDLYSRRPPADWEDPFVFKNRAACLKLSRLEYVLGTQGIVDRNPVVEFDIDHAIMKNGPFPWIRAPIVADLDG